MSNRWVLTMIRLPSPLELNRNSEAIIPTRQRAIDCRTPVIVNGSVYGTITCTQSFGSLVRYERATSSSSSFTLRAPSSVLIRIGQSPKRTTTTSFARNSKPRTARMNGIKATIGVA